MITPEQVQQHKDTLPRGWGRFGKAVDFLTEISRPDEELIATCVTLNPTFQHRSISTAGTLLELSGSTNTVLAVTTKRLVVIATGATGAPRSHHELAFQGLSITSEGKKEVTLRWPEGEARFRGAAKTQLPDFLAALNEQIQPS